MNPATLPEFKAPTTLHAGPAAFHFPHELFETQAATCPASTAILFEGRPFSYEEVNARANELAHHLIGLGVGPEALVGLCLERSPEMLIALLGIWKAGAAYVPLDPAYPPERLRYMLADTAAAVLVTRPHLNSRLRVHGARVVEVESICGLPAPRTTANPDTRICPQNLAYCIYTSGSTGKPKAVAVSFASVTNHIMHMTQALGIRPDDSLLQFTSIGVDAALEEIFPAWAGGATLVMHAEGVPSNKQFLQWLHDDRISVVSLPSSYWHQWVDELPNDPVDRPAALRLLFVGGEKLHAEKLRRWRSIPWSREVDFLTDYGPTEATISCATYAPAHLHDSQRVPIGKPIANVQIHILDAALKQEAPGVTGELWVAGAALARGYLNHPALTAEKFIPNPFGEPGSRMYKTGDLGYWLQDGSIQFVGRADDQVKILGHRIEPGEIEAVLLRCAGVRQAVVVGREDARGNVALIAYVVADGFSEAAIRSQLAATLPTVMMPSVIVSLPALPLSPVNAKVDRSRLPDPPIPGGAEPAGASALEQAISELFVKITGCPLASVEQDLVLAGVDSLRALRFLSRVSEATGCSVSFSDFIRLRTVSALVTRLRQNAGEKAQGDPGLEDRLVHQIRFGRTQFPQRLRHLESGRRRASNGQQRLWFLNKLGPGAAYSIPLAYRIHGSFSPDRLDAALTEIVRRHEALRTGLAEHDGVVWQEIAPPRPVHSRRVVAESFAEAMQIAQSESAAPFDLTQSPLLRALCIRFNSDEMLLLLIVHHAVFDAWSLAIFWRELSALYTADTASHLLASPPFQYADYVDYQREWLHSAKAEQQRGFWREQLSGELPLLRLNPFPKSADHSGDGAIEKLQVTPEMRQTLRDFAARHETTEFVVALSVFLAALYRYTLQDQVLVGVPSACRSLPEAEEIIGYFTNTVALRIFFPPGIRFIELLRQTSETLSQALTHEELPFDQIVDALGLSRRVERNPVFQAMFVLQSTPLDRDLGLEGLKVEEVAVHTGTAKMDLTCILRPAGEGMEGELEHALDVLDSASAAQFVSSFLTLLSEATNNPSAPLDELPMLSPLQQAQVIAKANGSFEAYSSLPPLHVPFEAQARLAPNAVAIEAGDQTVTYAELNARANRLARLLLRAGAAPERLIGVRMERSIDQIAVLLAILKCGAAFVPLDPSLPMERVRAIVEDARLLLMIVQDPQPRAFSARVIQYTGDDPAESGEDLNLVALPENAAYVYYTSGSTGMPKGVVLEHQCAMNRLEWLRRRYPLNPGDRVLHKTPLIFDVAIWEIFGPLSAGAIILMADPRAESDVNQIGSLLQRERTVFVHFVPSMLDAYLTFAPQRIYPDLRWVQLSGEAVSKRLLERFGEHFLAECHNLYGQTETSEVAGWESGASEADAVPIGAQIGIYRLYLLDASLSPVPPGVPGEICVAGVGGLARGYFGRPDLTAERFVPNPYALFPGERLYRTGDLARSSDGNVLEYLGRIDNQTKIRGCRVETVEVEGVLARHPSVKACAVVARPDEAGSNRLVAYVVGDRGAAGSLASHGEKYMPKYMIPEVWVYVDSLPLTPSGKLDRLRLPEPGPMDFEVQVGDSAPGTPIEAELAALWKQILRLEKVGRTDNFFLIGGNSIKCLQVLARVRETYGVEISVRVFFAGPSIAGLASAIERSVVALVGSLSDKEASRRLEELGV